MMEGQPAISDESLAGRRRNVNGSGKLPHSSTATSHNMTHAIEQSMLSENTEAMSIRRESGISRIEEICCRKLQCDAAWSDVGAYIEASGGLPATSENRRKFYERVLYESDTILTAHFLVMRRCRYERTNGEGVFAYTLGELAQEMVQEVSDSAIRTMKQKIRDKMLPRVGAHYGLFEFSKPSDISRNGTACYKIWASGKLMEFYNTCYVPRLLEAMDGN
jgi:hypothetical protein